MLTVSSAAADTKLLSLAEMKSALGITDTAFDSALTDLGVQLSEAIARECGVATDGVTPPTFRKETLIDTLRLSCAQPSLRLSRRFVVSVSNIVVAGVTLTTDDYEVDASAGILHRLDANGAFKKWGSGLTVITYVAGFDTVPGPLKLAAWTMLQEAWTNKDRDLTVKSEKFEGVGGTEWFDNQMTAMGYASAAIRDVLAPFRSIGV
jgi:hypothetical protein